MSLRFCGSLLLLALSPFAVRVTAQAPTTDSAGNSAIPSAPTLQQVVATALHNNFDVITARLHVDSAQGESRIAASYPNPTAAVIPGLPFQYGVSADVDIGPERWYRTRAAGKGKAATVYDLHDQMRQTAYNVRQAFYDLLLDDSLVAVADAQRVIFVELLSADSTRVRSGDVPERNVTTSELQLAIADANLAKVRATARAAAITLQLTMGETHPTPSFRVTGQLSYAPVDLPLDSLGAIADVDRPDAQGARARVTQSEDLLSYSRSLLVPVPNLGVTYQPSQPYLSTPPFASGSHIALSLALPLPLFNWYGGEQERANAGLAAARVVQERTQAQIASDVAEALDTYRANAILVQRFAGGLLNKTQSAVETARYAYQHGAISLLELLDAVRTNTDIQTEYYSAIHDYWVSVAALSRAVGRDLVPD